MTKFIYHIAAFMVGFYFGCLLFPLIKTESQIPEGAWESFYIDSDLSLQINVTQSTFDEQSVSTWVREDRLKMFEGTSGLSGQTIFSKVTFDCGTLTAGIVEQRVFKSGMIFIDKKSGMDGTLKSPTELMAAISLITLCSPKKSTEKSNLAPPVKQQQEEHNENFKKPSLFYDV
jgi:hypothetical protein